MIASVLQGLGFRGKVIGLGCAAALAALIPALTTHAGISDLQSFGGHADHRVGANGIDSGIDGTCSGTSFSSPSGAFTSADLHKVFVVTGDSTGTTGAGPGGWDTPARRQVSAPLFTTIASVQDAQHVTLSDACTNAIIGTAQWDIGTDNTSSLQACLNAGNCTVPAGNYLFNGFVRVPSSATLSCQPGATLFFPRHDQYAGSDTTSPGNMSFLELISANNVTIQNCTFAGTNIRRQFDAAEFNYFVMISGSSRNNSILGNTATNGWSDGDFDIDGYTSSAVSTTTPCSGGDLSGRPANVPSDNLVSGNTFRDCGYQGFAMETGNYNRIENNTFIDCSFDIEPNDACQNGPVFNNIIRGNTLKVVTRAVWFYTCAAPSCLGAGGATEQISNNNFYGPVQLLPFCSGPTIGQPWTDNAYYTASGQACELGSPGCPTTSGCSPTLPPSTGFPSFIFAADGSLRAVTWD